MDDDSTVSAGTLRVCRHRLRNEAEELGINPDSVVPPGKPGRPRSQNPSKAALKKRAQRAKRQEQRDINMSDFNPLNWLGSPVPDNVRRAQHLFEHVQRTDHQQMAINDPESQRRLLDSQARLESEEAVAKETEDTASRHKTMNDLHEYIERNTPAKSKRENIADRDAKPESNADRNVKPVVVIEATPTKQPAVPGFSTKKKCTTAKNSNDAFVGLSGDDLFKYLSANTIDDMSEADALSVLSGCGKKGLIQKVVGTRTRGKKLKDDVLRSFCTKLIPDMQLDEFDDMDGKGMAEELLELLHESYKSF